MERRKIPTFIACAVLFFSALFISLHFTKNEPVDFEDNTHSIILSEILSSNSCYPAPNGKFLDFIEIRNVSSSSVDISGYMLSDDAVSIGYIFPEGTVVPSGGYALCWCDKSVDSDDYASFGLSRVNGDSVYLYNTANVVIDKVDVPVLNSNIAMVRLNSGEWSTAAQATPGYPNTDAGYAAYLHSKGGDSTNVAITEIMTGNSCVMTAADGYVYTDWVELKNLGLTTADLSGAYLSDDPADPTKWRIDTLQLAPGEIAVIRCAGSGAAEGEADFALPSVGCTVVLTGNFGNTLCSVECPILPRDCSYALSGGAYSITQNASPGFENTEKGLEAYLKAMNSDIRGVVISEVMSTNLSTVTNAAGQLCDWVELTNTGKETVTLDGCYLSDDSDERGRWRIPALTLAPGESAVICCSGEYAGEGEADFALAAEGFSLTLSGPAGNIIHQLDVPRLDSDRSWALLQSGSYYSTELVSPGFDNSEEGHLAYRSAQAPLGALVVSEVMPSNSRYLVQSDGNYYDWVELVNISEQRINLSDYSLSDKSDEPFMFSLPGKELAPGERIIVICSGQPELNGAYIHAPFTLSREESWLYVSDKAGHFIDYVHIYDVPYGYSVGRSKGDNAICYFAEPTPKQENGLGLSLISPTPAILTADGVYDNIGSLSVEIEGEGTVRYTLDGSTPTELSPVYTEPIVLTSTAVLRAASFVENYLPSDTVTAAYIINEQHTLPVLSLTAEPGDLFGVPGIYSNSTRDVEVPCNLKLFENGTGFSIDAGVKMYGHTGLENPKKSFKVNFGGRYGEKVLNYPVYGDDAPQIYDALVVRSGQDYPMTIFRDELFTSLCRDMGDSVLAQRDKFCILYVNGNYFGIYCLKEAFTEMFYAQNMGTDTYSVSLEQAPVGIYSEIYQLFDYCKVNDLSQPEHYEYVCSKVDIDSLIDWMIIQGYSCNGDVQQNLRYFKSTETGNKWQFAFYDLDWAFYFHNPFAHVLGEEKLLQHETLTINIMKNAEFRDKFLTRAAELMNTVLSDENVLSRIDYYEALLDAEVTRERQNWSGSYNGWQRDLNTMRCFLTETDHWGSIINQLRLYIGLTEEEAIHYFGRC